MAEMILRTLLISLFLIGGFAMIVTIAAIGYMDGVEDREQRRDEADSGDI